MSEKSHRVPVRKKSPTEIVLHENRHGIRMIRYDYATRSKVKVTSGNIIHRIYRFARIDSEYTSPYISWANLDCCGGWVSDESYLQVAVQEGKKLYAGLDIYVRQVGSQENARKEVERILSELPEGCTGGFEPQKVAFSVPYFICRTGSLSDYYDIDRVLDYYEQLGVMINDADRQEVKQLSTLEIKEFGSENPPIDYINAYSLSSLIVTGLLLGYPIESTVSILQGN